MNIVEVSGTICDIGESRISPLISLSVSGRSYIKKEYFLELIKERGWSQNETARRAGISKSELSKVLTGKHGAGPKVSSALLMLFPQESVDTLFIYLGKEVKYNGRSRNITKVGQAY
jgi:lambda repressor-like predicted transcriptional regulator